MSTLYLKQETGKTKIAYCSVSSIFNSSGKIIGKYINNTVYTLTGEEIGSTVENLGYYYSAKYFTKLNSNTIFSSILNNYYTFDGDSEEALACCIAYYHQIANNKTTNAQVQNQDRQQQNYQEINHNRDFMFKKQYKPFEQQQSKEHAPSIKFEQPKAQNSQAQSASSSDAPILFGILGILFIYAYIVTGFQQWSTFFKDLFNAELPFLEIISKHNGLLVPIVAVIIGAIVSHILHAKKFGEFLLIYSRTFIAVILLASIVAAILTNFWTFFLGILGYVCVSWQPLILAIIVDYLITRFILN